MELSGAEYPDGIPETAGKSILPLLAGSQEQVHKAPIFWEHEGNAAMRWGKWKLVREYKKPWELFNLEIDRTEMHDLSKSEMSKRDEMVSMWEAWATKHEVSFPTRFNMYEFLNAKRKRQKAAGNKK